MTRQQTITFLFAAVLVTSCVAERRDWAFVQSVGGLALGEPYRTASGVMLPVSVDVSGLRAITTEPTNMNSALTVRKVAARREGHTILLTLITTLVGDDYPSPKARDVALGMLEPGRYSVVYANPDDGRVPVGEVMVP
jgi:hypothetical protein